jgi:hypothetical protein
MSANRSWDIRPRERGTRPRVARDPVLARGRKMDAGPRSTSLKSRRRRARRRLLALYGVLALLLVGSLIYGLWRPAVRIENVEAAGAHAETLPGMARAAISGTYFYLLPRNSIFIVPKEAVRTAILDAYPDVAAVSVSRTGLDSLFVNALPRVSAFTWCGSTYNAGTDSCYEADAEGYLFAPLPIPGGASATTTDIADFTLHLYAPLVEADASSPLRAHIKDASRIPDALRFVRAMQSLGAKVTALAMRDDEADVYTTGGTRLTYVLGHEQDAANLAATALPTINVNDGSLQYVDLRFSGKVYYKKKGE